VISYLMIALRRDLSEVLWGVVFSVLGFCFLSIWRHLDSDVLLIAQILIVVFLLYALFLLFAGIRQPKSSAFHRLVASLVAFTILSFSLLNIDRSRSVYVLKWVSESSTSFESVTVSSLATVHELSGNDVSAFKMRLSEQTELGFLHESNGAYRLTIMGSVFIWFAERIARLANLRGYLNA